MIKKIISGISFICCTAVCAGQKPYRFFNTQTYGREQGFRVDDAVNDISCDDKGFVWISSGNGLCRFSGTLFKQFPVKKNAAFTLPGNNVRFFRQDKKGKYFLGVDGSGLSIFDDSTGNFHSFTLRNDSLHLEKYELAAPFFDDQNNLWIGLARKGIVCINTTTHAYRFYDTKDPATGNHGFVSTAWINFIIQSKNGSIWAGTNYGIINIDPGGGKFVNYYHKYTGLNHSNGGIYEDADGTLWLGTWGQGLLHFYPAENKWEQYFIRPDKINGTENILHSVLYKSNDEFWVGSYYGVQVFNKKDKKFYPAADLQYEVSQAGVIDDPKQSKFIEGWYITADKQGNLWTFKDKTITRIRIAEDRFPYRFVPFGKPGNSAAFAFTQVYQNPYDSEYFLSSGFGNGLYTYNSITATATNPGGANAPRIPYHINFTARENNRLWLCTESGLFIYDLFLQRFVPLPAGMEKFSTGSITAIAFSDSLIWIGANSLFEYDRHSEKLKQVTGDPLTALPAYEIYQLLVDKAANLWIAYGGGKNVYCIANKTGKLTDYNLRKEIAAGNAESVAQSANGSIFFSSRGNGLYRIEKPLTSEEKIVLYTTADGLPSDRIHNISCDSAGYLWLGTSNGISICNTTNMRFADFNTDNYFPQNEYYGTVTEAGNGKFIVPLQFGYTIIDRDSILQKEIKEIPITIQRFTINGFACKTSVDYGGDLSLPYNQNNFSIDFSALCFDDAKGINYYYSIKGLNNDTVNIHNLTNITLYALPPGNYTLQIFLKDRNKAIQKRGYELHFVIHPPFWRTWWFTTLCVLLLIYILYLLYRYRINQLLRLQKVRNSIAQDLHDEVGSTMTTISILSDVAKKQMEKNDKPAPLMDEIGNNARELMEKLDDIVWSVNPNNDTFKQMTLRMKRDAIDLLNNKGIKVNFDIPAQSADIVLAMDKRRNIYLVFKEAINNISKYAEAAHVNISIQPEKHLLKMQIKDDGKGFDINEIEKGNGLDNMQERAKQCGGECRIISATGKGTVIEFRTPL